MQNPRPRLLIRSIQLQISPRLSKRRGRRVRTRRGATYLPGQECRRQTEQRHDREPHPKPTEGVRDQSDHRRSDQEAEVPRRGIAATAVPVGTPGVRPATEIATGNAAASPAPTQANPAIAAGTEWLISTTVIPNATSIRRRG